MLFYYGGHGCVGLSSGQNVVLNETSGDALYPLEERLRVLAQLGGKTAVVGMFDCSRVPASPGLTLGQSYDLEKEEDEQLKKGDIFYYAFKACHAHY